ncbi:MAG TPA: glycosyltransferase family 4 protein [Chryseosolibacter sp.]|nr:glycosyltransferase family 4 protein [Chryseosolibacter sp.]
MKVVILHQHFNTPEKGGPLRSYYLAKAITDAGIDVTVVTAHNHSSALTEHFEGIEVHYLPVKYENRFGFYARVSSFFRFMVLAARTVAKIRQVNLVYAISVPLTVGLAARRIKSRQGIPYIFEVGDLWPDAPIDLGIIKNQILISLFKSLERRIYKDANCIVALSESIAEVVGQRITNKQIHIIPNMSDTAYYGEIPDGKTQLRFNDEFVITYAGAIGYANGLDFLLKCANVMQRHRMAVRFLICGEGAMLGTLQITARHLSLNNVTFIPFSGREEVRQILHLSDACFICYRPEAILETGSPNKYFDALAAGKPVIINFGGWIKKEIEENNCGVYINPADPESIISAVSPLIRDRHLQTTYGTNARNLALRKYGRKDLTEKFIALLKGCV